MPFTELKCIDSSQSLPTRLDALDSQTPGGVYLCQVGADISCGACCGLYNVADLSERDLTYMLSRRTKRFSNTARTVAAIEAFAQETENIETQLRPFSQLHHCPYIGLIDGEGRQRVGCLLHPLGAGNNGVDFRGMSYYGGMACRTYFCATTRALARRYKQVLRQVLDHWYYFGLVITEKDLLSALLGHLETQLGRHLEPNMVTSTAGAHSLRNLLTLKCRWPFRPPSHATACHYLFSDKAHPKPPVDYDRLGVVPSIYDDILCEMPSIFNCSAQLRQAEALVESHLMAVVQALMVG